MTFTVEQKSQLAKLLATENLTIEHQKVPTARFDPKNRVLYCPVWQDMSGALYDLLMGHEVGHALFTPPEGWHDAVSTLGPKYKGFLNVVEDARIEKKIQRKYPGLKSSFVKGYQSLIERNLFQTQNRDINKMSFIDRLNLHLKLGEMMPITFNNTDEIKLVNQVKACETWEDVLAVTKSVFDYSKNEQFENLEKMLQSQMQYSEMDPLDGTEEYEESDYDFDSDNEVSESKEKIESADSGESVEGDQESTSGKSDSEKEAKSDSEKTEGSQINPYKDSHTSKSDQYDPDSFMPTCETDEAFRSNEITLLDEKSKPYTYVKIPKVNFENILTPVSVVQGKLYDYYFKDLDASKDMANKLVNEFKSKNDSYIGLLAKEFEMKKAARAYSKAKTSTTGDIDINKLYKYQVEDNIFKKMMRVPKGKSHGLILLLDRSGSMSNNMANSIEQILVMSAFCRRVNIPFVVYGFGDSDDGYYADFKKSPSPSFSREVNELELPNVYLREYLNSRMTNMEYNSAIRNMLMLKRSYESRFFGRPMNESLGNTPLIQAMVALEEITNKFRKVNNLDKVNLVIVHDGDADSINSHFIYREPHSWENENKIDPPKQILGYKHFDLERENVYLRDGKIQMKVTPERHDFYNYNDGLRLAIFNWYISKTGAKIFGFFIAGENSRLRQNVTTKYRFEDGKSVYAKVRQSNSMVSSYHNYSKSVTVSNILSEIKEKKFVQSYNPGYESFFIIPGGADLAIENDDFVVSGTVTANKLKNAFLKANKRKQVSRVMVSRFIDGIAV